MAIELQDYDSIERCPHDEENPYAQISRALIRDTNLSPDCCWLIIFLLANKEGWKINVRQVVNHCKGRLGRDRVYKMFEEAIQAGYICRIETLVLGKKRYKYRVSESPKFKKSFLFPENQDTENQDTENQDGKERVYSKKEHIKDPPLLSPPPFKEEEEDPLQKWIQLKKAEGKPDELIHQAVVKLQATDQKSIMIPSRYLDTVLDSLVFKKRVSELPSSKEEQIEKARKAAINALDYDSQKEIELERTERHRIQAKDWHGKAYKGISIELNGANLYVRRNGAMAFTLPLFAYDEYWDSQTRWLKDMK